MLRVLVCNRSDPASVNLCQRLLEMAQWQKSAPFRGVPSRDLQGPFGATRLVEVAGPTVTDEALDADLAATGWPIQSVWFLSKHAAASGQASLTVHPIGNPGEARFGGQANHLCPTAPRDMGNLLRALRGQATRAGLPHQVTFEATHHGPSMTLPSLFVEIGSDLASYEDPRNGAAAAAAILEVLSANLGGNPPLSPSIMPPVYVGVGGGHYMPRATDLAHDRAADFGHLLPNHALTGPEVLQKAWDATPGAVAVHVHKKGMPGELRRQVLTWILELDLPIR